MINLEDIKSRNAIIKLQLYSGRNPYIHKLKDELVKNGKLKLTATQAAYILDNYDKDPIKIDRVIAISEFIGETLKTQYELPFIPPKIYFGFILADTEKAFHVFGKLTQKQKENGMYWIPKTQVMEDPYFEPINVDVDFEKYIKLDVLKRIPYKHQEIGVKFLLSRNGCILADDMGLGKCYQSIVAALECKAKKILIVCPTSVKITWEREINAMQEYDTAIIDGRTFKSAKFTIINYDILRNFHTVVPDRLEKGADPIIEIKRELVNSGFDLVIIDEAHKVKDHKSIRGSIMVDLCVKFGIERVWLLTGTPIANRPMDFYNLMKLIKAPLADNWKFYVQRYCAGKKFFKTLKNGKKKQIWLTDGASNLDELSVKTRNLLLRRLKSEISDMPDKTVTPTYHELSDRELIEYDNLWDDYIAKRKVAKKKGEIDRNLVELILLRKFNAMAAISRTIEMCDTALEEEQKVIIFTTFNDELSELSEYYGNKCVIHNGSMSDVEKQNSVDAFQNNPNVKVFIGNVISAGVGITLTKGTVVIFNSFDWTPGNNEQAEDRAYRIGQKANVNVYYQLFKNTISTRMWETLHNKKDVIDIILGAKTSESEVIDSILDLILEV